MYEGAGILDGACGYLARSSSATSKIRARSSIACAHPRDGHVEEVMRREKGIEPLHAPQAPWPAAPM